MASENQFQRTNFGRPDESIDTGEVRVFSTSGRIGRVRYIGYTTGFMAVVSIIAFIGAESLSLDTSAVKRPG